MSKASLKITTKPPARTKLLTETETSEFLRLAKPTLRSWRSRGTGPRYYQVGGRILYSLQTLETFLEEECLR